MHADIRQAHKRRLHHLRVQAALRGYSTPPEILLEIEDIERRIKKSSSLPKIRQSSTSILATIETAT